MATRPEIAHVIYCTLRGRHGRNIDPILMKICRSAIDDLTNRFIFFHFSELITRAEIDFRNLNVLPPRQREREQDTEHTNTEESRVLWLLVSPITKA